MQSLFKFADMRSTGGKHVFSMCSMRRARQPATKATMQSDDRSQRASMTCPRITLGDHWPYGVKCRARRLSTGRRLKCRQPRRRHRSLASDNNRSLRRHRSRAFKEELRRMPPTELDGEAADRRTHGPPDRCLLQQLRAAAGAFFRAARSHAGDEAPPDQVQRIARFGTGGQCARPRTGRDGCGVCWQRHASGRTADRDGLRRASIRQFRSSTWRWPRYPPRRGPGPQRRAARCPIEGRGQNAVLAARRRPRRIAAGPARISRQRSDACARNSDHTGAGGGLNR